MDLVLSQALTEWMSISVCSFDVRCIIITAIVIFLCENVNGNSCVFAEKKMKVGGLCVFLYQYRQTCRNLIQKILKTTMYIDNNIKTCYPLIKEVVNYVYVFEVEEL